MVSNLVGPSGRPITTNGTGPGRPPKAAATLLQTGLSMWKGTVSEEYLAELKPWSKAVKVFQEMEDDIVIGALYESISSPLLDAKFKVLPASPSTKDIEAAKWLQESTIDSPSFDWLDHVTDMLEALSFGFSLSEILMEKSKSGRLELTDLMPIGQETLKEWGKLDKHGRPKSFIQTVVSDNMLPHQLEAPMEKLLHYTFRGRKRNPMGRALSRNLYRAWYFKKNLEVVEAIGAERDVGNVPLAELSEGFLTDADMTKLKEALSGLRIDEAAYIITPPNVKITPFGSGGKTYNIREMIRDYQHLIRQRFFMDFISLGSESVGTQALAKEVTGFFSLALGSIQHQMTGVWNRQLVPWMFRHNMLHWDGITALPKIKWEKPGKINVQSLAQSVTQLLTSQAIHWNKPLEDHLREAFEVPPITDEEIEERKRQDVMQAQLMAGPQSQENPKGESRGAGKGDGRKAPQGMGSD
jgi:hypothetical protein